MNTRRALLVGALAFATAHAEAQCQPAEVAGLTWFANIAQQGFARVVDTWGDYSLVGAESAREAYLFRRDPLDAHAWSWEVTFSVPIGTAAFGNFLALRDDIAAFNRTSFGSSNSVVVFERNFGGPAAWGQSAMLTVPPDGGWLGRGIAIDGDTIAVGSTNGGTNYGSAYVFRRDAGGPGNWGMVQQIVNPVAAYSPNDFGLALALEHDTLVVGAPRQLQYDGRVYVFERDLGGPEQWGLAATLAPSAPLGVQGQAGTAVALHGDRLIFGIPYWGSGRVHVYERVAGVWTFAQSWKLSGATPSFAFGTSVGLWDDRAIVGAPGDNINPNQSGAVYVFAPTNGPSAPWSQVARVEASDGVPLDRWGTDLALWRDTAVIGNLRNTMFGSVDLGKAHVLDLVSPAPPIPYCTAGTSTHGCTATLLGIGTPSASDDEGFDLVAVGLDGHRQAAIFYGISGPMAAPIFNSSTWRCVAPPRQRMGVLDTGGTPGVCDGRVSVDWNEFVHVHAGALGAPFTAGTSVWAQGWWRDPQAPLGGAATHGLSFTLCP